MSCWTVYLKFSVTNSDLKRKRSEQAKLSVTTKWSQYVWVHMQFTVISTNYAMARQNMLSVHDIAKFCSHLNRLQLKIFQNKKHGN
jgi:hypothetical protein